MIVRSLWLSCVVALVAACPNPELQEATYYDQRIAPILQESCVSGTADARCHAESTQKPGEALGNLDLSTFEAIHRRSDLLRPYGSYPEPVLLMKAVKPGEITLTYAGESRPSEIVHAGGGILSRDSEAFVELQQWLRDGATRDGVALAPSSPAGSGACATALRPEVEPYLERASGPGFDRFVADVAPIMRARCSFGSCHGSSQSDFYLTCGDDPEQTRHNFIVAQSFVAAEGDRSELLLRPLAVTAGGVDHSGGAIWASASESEFEDLRAWAREVGPFEPGDESPELTYFADRVMPVLLRRGCAMPQCHSPQGFNDFRLRAGSRGFFSPLALRRNYETTLHEFVSLDSPDPNESRILKKNISRERGGIVHRAGITLLDVAGADAGGDPSLCPAGAEVQPTSYCTLVEWIRRERDQAVADGRVAALADGETVPVFYVDRPANPDRVIDFATYRGGARLMRVDATLGASGALLGPSGPPVALDLSSCGATGDFDVRRPELDFEGERLVFGLRIGEADGLNVYEANLDGSECVTLTVDGGEVADGVVVHNFDPVVVPSDPELAPGGAVVFASTRPGRLGRAHVSPRYKLPASNLWRVDRQGGGLEQMTVLSGSEVFPAVMHNGQITMTTEKATSDLYQLAGRRINWDLTDYHPLLAQRDTVGYAQATFIREGLDRNFVLVLSDAAARFAGGTLATFNRSVGPFESDRLGEPGYLAALEILDEAARDAGKGPALGAYRSPFPAPDGGYLVSYAAGSIDLTDPGASVDYDLVIFDPVSGQRVTLAGGSGFQVDGVVGYPRAGRTLFVNVPQLVFGGRSRDELPADQAWAHFPDLPVLATLLTKNRRGQREFSAVSEGDTLAVYSAAAPPPGSVDDGTTFEAWSLLGTTPLFEDGSAFVQVPAGTPVVLELRQGETPLLTMTEEHQFGPGEQTSLGVSREFFDGVCGGCHGSLEGPELDVVVNADALTGASVSLSRPDPASAADPL